MKNLKLILLLQAFVFGVLTVNADDDCCPDGSPPSVTCDDGTKVCDASECPNCTTTNPEPMEGFTDCCGKLSYNPIGQACCPNGYHGGTIVPGVSNNDIEEWCSDCTYVKTFENNKCCDDNEGSVSYKTTYACVCHSCIMSDCTNISWADYLIAIALARGNGPQTVIGLAILNGEIVGMNALCSASACPDEPCA